MVALVFSFTVLVYSWKVDRRWAKIEERAEKRNG